MIPLLIIYLKFTENKSDKCIKKMESNQNAVLLGLKIID